MKQNQGLANSAVFLIIALIIFIGAGAYLVGKKSSTPEESNTVEEPEKTDTETPNSQKPVSSDDGGEELEATTTIKIPVISIGTGIAGGGFGCDDRIVYINKSIPKTTMPLNAVYRELFALASEQVDGYYNVMARLKDLKFERAVLETGIAQIYLAGSFSGLGGVCDDPRPEAQLTAAAKQFPTVKSIEIYLNGNIWIGVPGESGITPALSQHFAYILARNAWGDCTQTDECEKMTVTASKQNGIWYVTAIYDGLHDDSVAATKKVSAAYYDDGTWGLSTVVTTQRCQPGRGHQDFSSELCI